MITQHLKILLGASTLSAALVCVPYFAAADDEIAAPAVPAEAGTEVADATPTTTASAPEQASESVSEVSADATTGGGGFLSNFSLNYTNILYGPSIGAPSSFQPTPDGKQDRDRPVFMKNYLTLGYNLTPEVAVSGTAYWHYKPVQGQALTLQDPFVRVSHSRLVGTDWGLNLYSDARVHFGVTEGSRQSDMIMGVQNFNVLSWQIAESRFSIGARASGRGNFYGGRGSGTDVELYLAPEADVQLSPTVSLTMLYEMGASHQFGDRASLFTNDGTDFEPGISWDITPSLLVNPYLNIFTGGKVNAASTSVGMFLSWTML